MLKRRTGIPWVADFRDLWTDSPYGESPEHKGRGFRAKVEKRLETSVLREADAVTTVTRGFSQTLSAHAPRGTLPIRVITNGYDPETIKGIKGVESDRFTIVYTGRFYSGTRTAEPLFKVLATLTSSGVIRQDTVEVRIFGPSWKEVQQTASACGLSESVVARPQVNHLTALKEQLGASLLLLVVGDQRGERDAIPAKLFEYLEARRPILALAPLDSEAAQVVTEARAGTVVPPDDETRIGEALVHYYKTHRANEHIPWKGADEIIEAYSRPRLTAQLAEVFDEVMQGHS